jgi:hypothetical protein
MAPLFESTLLPAFSPLRASNNIEIHGVLNSGLCCAQPLMLLPDAHFPAIFAFPVLDTVDNECHLHKLSVRAERPIISFGINISATAVTTAHAKLTSMLLAFLNSSITIPSLINVLLVWPPTSCRNAHLVTPLP